MVYLQQAPDRYVETLVSVVRGFKSHDTFAYQLEMAQGSGLLERIRRIRELEGIRPALGSSGFTLARATSTGLMVLAASLQVIIAPTQAIAPSLATVAPVVSAPTLTTQEAPQPREPVQLPKLQRPQVPIDAPERVSDEPEGWISPEILAMVVTVDPLDLRPGAPKHRVTNHDIMLYPEPKTYADLVATNRLIGPGGANYQSQLTMGRVMGTQFFSRPFYTGGRREDNVDPEPTKPESAPPIKDPRRSSQQSGR